MLGGDISDKLLNKYGFTYAGTTEQTDLTTLLIRAEKVNDFDTCLKKLSLCGLFFESACLWMGS